MSKARYAHQGIMFTRVKVSEGVCLAMLSSWPIRRSKFEVICSSKPCTAPDENGRVKNCADGEMLELESFMRSRETEVENADEVVHVRAGRCIGWMVCIDCGHPCTPRLYWLYNCQKGGGISTAGR